ncbi:MAG: 1-deoxy-D-xylulose-5-phosphate synthase [Fibrobacter sp.]|nr:1-deoxy-D-xylulose-5-phosphate synthase [Fibrobacter sp.]
MTKNLLDSIQSPVDLRALSPDKLPKVASEIRELMIDVVSKCGGHLAPSLGTVELTLALHYVFNTPTDKLVWDVGHQAYTHKILTGRKDVFHTLRQYGGISGFPRVSESEYDTLSVGHASTSISGALGMAMGRDIKHENHSVVAIIGDGSLSGGLALEGLNNTGSSLTNMTIILNDNEMSISKNVGALSRYLTRVLTDKRYNKIKTEIWDRLGTTGVGKGIRSLVSSIDDVVKHLVIPGKLFEDMGLRYLGPVDGHNINSMIDIFKFVKNTNGPQLVHVITKKGKGYSFAENDATKYHGVGSFTRETGDVIKIASQTPTFSDIFGKTLVEIARKRDDIVAITAAMRDGTKMAEFSKEFPNRFFDVGIAEGHAVTFAAGLATKGLIPVIALYSTFLQRAFDHMIHDVALDKHHVVFCIDRAGLVGDDGPTHHGMFDLSFVRSIPDVVIMAPRNENELRHMFHTAVEGVKGPVVIRYPRGGGVGVPLDTELRMLPIGVPQVITEGKKIAIVAIGDFFSKAENVRTILKEKGFSPALIDAQFVKPLDHTFYQMLFREYQYIVTLENNSLAGGFGSALLELAETLEITPTPVFIRFGLPDAFVTHGDLKSLHKNNGLDEASIVERILRRIG